MDLPGEEERAQIIHIMNLRYGSSIPAEYAQKLQGWTGAEIEQLAKDSLFDGLEAAFESIVPLSRTMKEDISSLQEWARTRARKANSPEKTRYAKSEENTLMSHISKIELEVKDLGTLEDACKRLDLKLMRNKQTFRWYGAESPCDHAIVVPGASYEIGVVGKEGRFELACDFFDRNLSQRIGPQGGLLKQAYAVEKTRSEARRHGYRVIEQKHGNTVQLKVRL